MNVFERHRNVQMQSQTVESIDLTDFQLRRATNPEHRIYGVVRGDTYLGRDDSFQTQESIVFFLNRCTIDGILCDPA